MTYAVHNWHTPAVKIDEEGKASIDGKHFFQMPPPIFTAETFEEAEAHRIRHKPDFGTAATTMTPGKVMTAATK